MGMRRSIATNTLVVVSNHTTRYYGDQWKSDVIHYVGMGLTGNQRLDFMQNKTLAGSRTNGVKVFLFEVFTKGIYKYRGEVKLVDDPYQKQNQLDYRGNRRNVWIFPLQIK